MECVQLSLEGVLGRRIGVQGRYFEGLEAKKRVRTTKFRSPTSSKHALALSLRQASIFETMVPKVALAESEVSSNKLIIQYP